MAHSLRTIVTPIALCLLLTGLLTGAVLSRSLQGLPPAEVGSVLAVDTQSPATPKPPQEIPAEAEQSEPSPAPAHPTPAQQPAAASEPGITILFPESRGDELRKKLKSFSEAGHDVLSYRKAREVMYWRADNAGGIVTTIYGQKPIRLKPTEWPDPQVLNCEHLWPQSKGAKRPPMRTDLFHLRPAVPRINSTRSNHPFGTPSNVERTEGQWKIGTNDSGKMVFEPPPSVRGDISRSLFYFSVRYGQPIPDTEELTLRRWHNGDPVDQRELRRASIIEEFQGNSNPFIIDQTTVDRIENF
jgi:endonuclease I